MKAAERLKSLVEPELIKLGAVKTENDPKWGKPAKWYVWGIDTKFGQLGITVYETWIATRFDSEPKNCNPGGHTGKWNFYANHKRGRMPSMEDAQIAAEWFLGELKRRCLTNQENGIE